MRQFRFLLLISLAAAGCGDDGGSCGSGGIVDTGLTAGNGDFMLVFDDFTSGQNNDCPDADAPAGVISLTVGGQETDGHGSGIITLCIPRPDLLTTQAQSLDEQASGANVHLIDLNGTDAAGCVYAIDGSRVPTGTVTASGLCENGSNASGYGLSVQGALSLTQTCNGGSPTTVSVTLAGSAAVAAQ
ncbi:MAG TPA: hypothetical protein VGM88_10475 [Kofleriaceae bacterium]|jgi:hypothetical protein